MYYGIGHTYSSLKLAMLLKDRGYRVVYVGLEDFCFPAKQQGFEVVVHDPVIVPSIKRLKLQKKRNIFLDNIINLIYDSVIKEARQKLELFKCTISQIAPDLVIVDEEHAEKYFYYETMGITTISVQTMPEKTYEANIPPFTSYFCPTESSMLSKWIVDVLWLKLDMINLFRRQYSAIKYLGQDRLSITKRLLIEHGSTFSELVENKSSFNFCVKKGSILILSATDFDFPRKPIENIFRVGPIKDSLNINSIGSPRFQSLCSKLNTLRRNSVTFVVFCSMGTATFSFPKRMKRFFLNMRKVALMEKEVQFVFSVSDFFKIEQLQPLPSNVTVFTTLPQLELLKYCDLMVTHGGMNSITECILNEVPMLVYPLSPQWDQPGNSARVVYHKLGLRGRIGCDSPKTISKKIQRIKNNLEMYKTNIRQMKQKFEEKNNSTEVVTIIESLLSNSTNT